MGPRATTTHRPALTTVNGTASARPRLRTWLVAVLACGLAVGCSEETVPGQVVGGLDAENDGLGGGLGDFFGGKTDATTNPKDLEEVPEVEQIEPGKFGAVCLVNSECDSGLCVDGPGNKICTKTCTDDCPKGFKCTEVQGEGGNDTIYMCIPKHKKLCNPCQENADCNDAGQVGNVCLEVASNSGSSGSFCAAACDEVAQDCPGGFACEVVINPANGAKTHQCVRKSGICECSAKAKELGLKTTCSIKNLHGKCTGFRICGAEGLQECTADVPAEESCDGKDNDCNGKTDDFTSSAGCDVKNEFGSCKGVIKECVDGKAVCDGPTPKPEACNGLDDNCNGQTDEGLCEDGDPCTLGICNTDGTCQQKQLAGMACDDGSICTQTDKCISGNCVGGNNMDCDDKDPCTADTCDPFTGCKNTPSSDAVCTDDGNVCTQDICKDGKCLHPQANDGTACPEDGKPCTADTCVAGGCTHKPADGLKCAEDGNACTDDLCQGGACAHINNTAACEDGNACTVSDKCNGGKCMPGLAPNCNDNNPCTNDSCVKSQGCVHTNNDFAACTSSSSKCPVGQCAGGQCFPKPNVTCQTKIDVDLCQDVDVAGTCTAAGQCVVTKAPAQYTCPGCNGICLKCVIQLCLPFPTQ